MTIEEEIRALEDEILRTQKNKSTEHHIGRLKAKIARLREEQDRRSASKSRKAGVRKAGDATVVLVGPIGSGKSTLLNRLTGARPADDPYSLEPVPGIMAHKGAKIQILDVPDLMVSGDSVSTVRDADLMILVTDPSGQDLGSYLEKLYSKGVRVNQRPPDVLIRRTSRGGINLTSTTDPDLDRSSIEAILREYKIHSADILIRESLTEEKLIDSLESNRRYLRAVKVLNKADLMDVQELQSALSSAAEGFIPVSALDGSGLDRLKDEIFDGLDLMRIFMKPQGGQADMKDPMIMQRGASIGDLCDRIHKDFRERFRYATVWGSSAKHAGQRAGLEHVLSDGDIITIVIQK